MKQCWTLTNAHCISDHLLKDIIMITLNKPELFRQQCYIDGRWVDADGGAVLPVTNPATGETIGSIPKMGAWAPTKPAAPSKRLMPAGASGAASRLRNVRASCTNGSS